MNMVEDVISKPTLAAEDVSRYLAANPSFFLKHQQLLADMFLPHESGKAVSLLERQVSLLRERNIETRKRLSDMLEQGQANDVLFNKTRGLILNLLDAKHINQLSENLIDYCQNEFQVDAVQFTLIANENTHKVSACQVLAEAEIQRQMGEVLNRDEALSGVFRQQELDMMFAQKSADVASAVVMPIRANNKTIAFIALGSEDANYFKSSMDTLFLGFIADVLAKLLPKYC
jgi:hypothetical protein